MERKVLLTYLMILVAMMIWGMSFVWYKVVYSYGFQPISTIFMRLLISSFFLFVLARLLRKFKKVEKGDWGKFLLLALFEPFGYFFGESFGVNEVSPAIASIVIATIPLFSPFAAYFFLKERLTIYNILGVVFSFCGLLVVMIGPDLKIIASLSGLMFLFMAVLMALFYGVYLKRLATRYHPLMIVLVQNVIGIFYFLPFLYFMEPSVLATVQWNLDLILNILYLGVLGSSLAFVFYTQGINRIGMTKANVFSNTIPIFTAVFSYFVINEPFSIQKIMGILIVLGGLFLSQLGALKLKPLKAIDN